MSDSEATPTTETWDGPVVDEADIQPVVESTNRFVGRVWDVRTDRVEFDGGVVDRDYIVHTGAVAVVALDADDRIYLLRQYRHPVAMALFEIPAGLLDVPGEDPLETARRELAEEAGLIADDWKLLVDFFTSPGGSSEMIRVYLARNVEARDGGRIQTGEAEELSLPGAWVPLDEAVALVLDGSLSNPSAITGILATSAARADGWVSLRDADVGWPARDRLIKVDRVRSGRFPD